MGLTETSDPSTVHFSPPTLADGAEVYQLIKASPPLDVNSQYCYHIVCEHFAKTSVVARLDGAIVGFISGYTLPQHDDILFIWQVAVSTKARGKQLASRMLQEIIARPRAVTIRFLHTTISPSNIPSQKLFLAFARSANAPMREREFLDARVFGEGHESEMLYEIGPIRHVNSKPIK
ncbi:diaminobutyrate acetyltransferase [Chrysiogenes arsenatis]|uniref:diaminobutyrate acetyltransferase n=1 Tax=Chrysiogenes arsenatis TaxID=309797 RepID=UPI000413E2D2|nr:diaminobutyrate acetyltransferase [Chrysiogenes arsenatis]